MIRALALALLATPALADGPVVPRFADETSASGIDHTFSGGWEYMAGGGAAAFDCNGDARPDLVLAGGENPAGLFVNDSATGGPLHFTRTPGGVEATGVTGAYPVDIDSDGVMDLALLRVGPNRLMRGLGNCRFEDAGAAWGFDGGDAWTTAFAATWERGAAWPTLAVGNYIDRREDAFPWGSCTENWLHRPDGTARRFAAPLPLKPSYCALSMLFTDWNRSGTPALRVSNDREYYKGGQEQLWRIDPGQPPALYGDKDGWKPLKIWGMGIASTDLTGDGFPDYFLASMADNKLQTLAEPAGAPPRPTFTDIAFPRGVIAQRPYTGGEVKPSTAWHAQFEDVNNDGLADLFIAKGNVSDMPDFAARDPNNLLLQRADGIFEEAGDRAGVASLRSARGAALADFNLDGWVDLVVVNRNAGAEVWRNDGAGQGHWVELRLRQPAPNPDAVGAWIEVRAGGRTQRREIAVGGGHAGGQAGFWHFGLGEAREAEARVIWPDGTEGPWQPIAADRLHALTRGQPPRPVTPP